MMINMHNQDPIGIQRAPRYGRKGIVRGTIEFDEENLAMFEKVKLVVRLDSLFNASARVADLCFNDRWLDRGASICG